MALFPMAIITLFWKDHIGLSLSEILILQALFSLATLLMEFPSGYLSDRIGYRFSLHLACLLGISGWTTYTLANSFLTVLIAEVQLGASYAFISGADSALLYESLQQMDRQEEYAKHDGRMTAWAQGGEAAGAISAGLLYGWFPLLPFILQIGVWVAALSVSRQLKNTPKHDCRTNSHWQEMKSISRKSFSEPGIRLTIIFGALLGLSSFYPVWLIQPYMQALNVPLNWFGPIWALANLTVSFGSVVSHRLLFHIGMRGMHALFLGLIVLGYTGLALTHHQFSFLFYYLLTIMRGLQGPLIRHVLHKQIGRQERASILSLKSLVFRLGFVLTAPLVGLLADQRGLHGSFLILTLFILASLSLLLVPYEKHIADVRTS